MISRDKVVRILIWMYFLMVILEGVMRKWILPGLATPLLVIRDPVALLAVILGLPHLIKNSYAITFIILGMVCVPLAIAAGHGNWLIAAFGARILMLHLPLVFLFPCVFTLKDLWRFSEVTLIIVLPMTVLIGFQYYLPQAHLVNVGIGGEGSSGFTGALGRYRCSGTFAFTSGVAQFYAIGLSLLAARLSSGAVRNPLWTWVSAGCLLLAVPLSISRSLAFNYALIGLMVLICGFFNTRILGRILMAVAALVLLLIPLSHLPIFQDSTEAFAARWVAATDAEGGDEGVKGVIKTRVLDSIAKPFDRLENLPLFGYGIGIGTQAGTYMFFGRRGFLFGEGEWFRMIGELGIPLTLLFMGLRIWIALILLSRSIGALRKGNPAPVMLSPMPFIWLILGDTSQPTALGFLVVSTGLWITAFMPAPGAEMDEEALEEDFVANEELQLQHRPGW